MRQNQRATQQGICLKNIEEQRNGRKYLFGDGVPVDVLERGLLIFSVANEMPCSEGSATMISRKIMLLISAKRDTLIAPSAPSGCKVEKITSQHSGHVP